MLFLPNVPRCQHLKVNGTQCGSPALKRNRFCFFHKRFQEEQIRLNCDRNRRGHATFLLPVLEDANSIQIALMQIMRLLASGQMDSKIAGLLLFALQTASYNLRRTSFEPSYVKDVVIDRHTIDQTCIGGHQWSEEDFPDPEPTEEEKAAAQAEQAAEAAAKARAAAKQRAEVNAALEAEANRLTLQGVAQRAAAAEWAARALQTSLPPTTPTPAPTPAQSAPVAPDKIQGPALSKAEGPSKRQHNESRPPASAKFNKKKEPKKVDMDQVRKAIRGRVRDWVMSTAKDSSPPTLQNGKATARSERSATQR
jgi:hypothetical protein